MFDRFGFVLVSFWGPKWAPGRAVEPGKSARGRYKTVLGSTWCGPFLVFGFYFDFLSLLGSSWTRFRPLLMSFGGILGSLGPVLGRLGLSWAGFGALRFGILGSYSPICLSTHRLIIPSTHGSSALNIPARRTARSD